jgi:hypothetical protein
LEGSGGSKRSKSKSGSVTLKALYSSGGSQKSSGGSKGGKPKSVSPGSKPGVIFIPKRHIETMDPKEIRRIRRQRQRHGKQTREELRSQGLEIISPVESPIPSSSSEKTTSSSTRARRIADVQAGIASPRTMKKYKMIPATSRKKTPPPKSAMLLSRTSASPGGSGRSSRVSPLGSPRSSAIVGTPRPRGRIGIGSPLTAPLAPSSSSKRQARRAGSRLATATLRKTTRRIQLRSGRQYETGSKTRKKRSKSKGSR